MVKNGYFRSLFIEAYSGSDKYGHMAYLTVGLNKKSINTHPDPDTYA